MNEQALNTIIQNSFLRENWGYKIPDPSGGQGTQRPFDGFGVFNGLPLYYETKIQKKYEAFNFNSKVETHQWANLLNIEKCLKVNHYNLIILGIWISRKTFRLFFFETTYLRRLQQEGIKSIKAKELQALVDSNSFLEIKTEVCHNGGRKSFIQNLSKLNEVIING